MTAGWRRRETLVLLGGACLTAPAALRAAATAAPRDDALVVVLGQAGTHAEAQQAAQSAGQEVIMASDPAIAWREAIAPALSRGRTVIGLGDPGFAFCIAQIAAERRCRFERGEMSLASGAFRPDARGHRMLPPTGLHDATAWRIAPLAPFGSLT